MDCVVVEAAVVAAIVVALLAVGLANLSPAGAAPTTIYTFNGDAAGDRPYYRCIPGIGSTAVVGG